MALGTLLLGKESKKIAKDQSSSPSMLIKNQVLSDIQNQPRYLCYFSGRGENTGSFHPKAKSCGALPRAKCLKLLHLDLRCSNTDEKMLHFLAPKCFHCSGTAGGIRINRVFRLQGSKDC